MSLEQNFRNIKIALIGDGGVGKTVYLNRLINGNFEQKYIATFGVEKKNLLFNTNYGAINFQILDVAGQEKFNDSLEKYENVEGIIMMFDLTSTATFRNINDRNLISQKPVVLVGNKCDIKEREVDFMQFQFQIREKMNEIRCPYYDISAKSNYNFEKPFLSLARQITGCQDLHFF
jgi:GTP-binding nuclear protein Ran